jgi:hypothetical protein
MNERIAENHPLRNLFRSALDKAFGEHGELYAPGVAAHLQDDVLCDFVHIDRLYRLKSLEGQTLDELPKMLEATVVKEGPERRLEVDSYIGDFVLFMGGFFPTSLNRGRWCAADPMVSKVGQIFVSFQQPLQYYAAEGRNAYGRAAETARIFAPSERETFSLLAEKFELYLELLRRVKALLSDEPGLHGTLDAAD